MSYKINMKYALKGSEGDARVAQRKYIIAHESGNQNDVYDPNAIENEVKYMKRNYQSAYSTYFVGGGGQVYQIGEPGYVSWASLNANPYAPVQIELARTADPTTFKKDYAVYVELLRDSAKKYGIPLTLDTPGNGIKTHLWVTKNFGGDHVDPVDYLKRWGITQKQFAKDLANGIDNTTSSDYVTTGKVFEVITSEIKGYKNPEFTELNGNTKSKGDRFKATVENYKGIQRLHTRFGGWYTANKKFVKAVK